MTTDAQGAWSFTPSGLGDGSHTIVASQTDSFWQHRFGVAELHADRYHGTDGCDHQRRRVDQPGQPDHRRHGGRRRCGRHRHHPDGTTAIGTAIVQGNGSWSSTVTLNNGSNSLTAG
ncbi:hypothetical protein [Bradyrhizobium sp. 15]|uniref:hypothetical protein n=1 Tax=Bradyrhizobium sp. 15 TaxID=2782633 RepID=UPI001FF7509F|nr:hypothetical protein [Bradyrhizobium sp. 15]